MTTTVSSLSEKSREPKLGSYGTPLNERHLRGIDYVPIALALHPFDIEWCQKPLDGNKRNAYNLEGIIWW